MNRDHRWAGWEKRNVAQFFRCRRNRFCHRVTASVLYCAQLMLGFADSARLTQFKL